MLLHEGEVESHDEEATDSEDYLPNDENLPSEKDSSAAKSMEEETVHVNTKAFDTEMATLGYHNLLALLPQLPVHEVPKVQESTPLIYTGPMPNAQINILKDIIPKKVLDHVIAREAKTTRSHQLRMKYGLQRAWTEKVLHSMAIKGGSFYSKLKKGGQDKKDIKAESRTKAKVKTEVKKEQDKESCIELGSSS